MPNHYNPLIKVKNNRRNNGEPLTLEEVNRRLGITNGNKNKTLNPLRGKTIRNTRRSARRKTRKNT